MQQLDRDAVLGRACLQRHRRPCADVLDDFRRGKAAKAGGGTMILAARKTGKKSGGEQIPRAGDVRHLFDGLRRDRNNSIARLASPRSALTAVSKSAVS